MLDAIVGILGILMFAAIAASVVGVIIGFIRKRWRFAIISGIIAGTSFLLIAITLGLSGELDSPETSSEPQQSELRRQQQSQVQSSIQPTIPLEPTKTPEPKRGLGISHVNVQKPFEQRYGITFEYYPDFYTGQPTTLSADGQYLGEAGGYPKLAILLHGSEDDIYHTELYYEWIRYGFATDKDAIDSMLLLLETVVPEWQEPKKWINETIRIAIEDECMGEFRHGAYAQVRYQEPAPDAAFQIFRSVISITTEEEALQCW